MSPPVLSLMGMKNWRLAFFSNDSLVWVRKVVAAGGGTRSSDCLPLPFGGEEDEGSLSLSPITVAELLEAGMMIEEGEV